MFIYRSHLSYAGKGEFPDGHPWVCTLTPTKPCQTGAYPQVPSHMASVRIKHETGNVSHLWMCLLRSRAEVSTLFLSASIIIANQEINIAYALPMWQLHIQVCVSLPRGRIQEIKHMTLVNFTHGFFLPAHKNLVIFTNHSLQYLQDVHHFHPRPPALLINNPALLTWRTSFFARGEPIHPCLWSANNCPTPLLLPLSPFHTPQFKLHYLHR
jgi:hypothetical protein